MRKSVVAALAVLTAFCAMAANPPRPARVDFTSQPEGATVTLDGETRGVTPLTLFDVKAGSHKAVFTLKSHETVHDFFTVGEDSYAVRHAQLTPEKGLLLVTTDPEGCDISLDGLSFGETPRLIANLDSTQTYRFLLQKSGYQSRTLEVKFNGRVPLARHEKLILDSGAISVITEPAGAKVTVNGIERGVSPIIIKEIPKGRATVSVELAGHKSVKRELQLNAGDEQNVSFVLDEEPGALFLTSVPSGARFYVNGSASGKGPIRLASLKPGIYSIKAEMDGYASIERQVRVPQGGEASEEFRLQSVRGRLEIKTSPAGAQILLDGHSYGVTKSTYDEATSDVMTIENVGVGEHTLIVRRDGYAEVVRHPVVENSRTAQVLVKMKRVFKPNVQVTTSSGVYRGVFIDNTPDAITIEVSMGITRSFPREDVRSIDFLEGGQ